MPNSHLQNCHVILTGDQVALGPDNQQVCYHVWLQNDLTAIDPLYKTPPNSARSSPPKLRITSKCSSGFIAEMLQCLKHDNLLNKALADKATADAERLARTQEAQRGGESK